MRTISSPPWGSQSFASVEERCEQLTAVSHAMWRLLKSKLDLTDQELARELQRASVATAELPKLIDCVTCHRPLRRAAKCCLYCGTDTQVTIERLTLTRERLPIA